MLKRARNIGDFLLLGVYAQRGVKADCIIRIAVLNVITLLGSIYILSFFVSFAVEGVYPVHSSFAIATVFIFLSSFALLHTKAGVKYIESIKIIVTLDYILFFSFLYATFEYGNIWTFLIPSMVILVMKFKKGIIISFVYLLTIALIDVVLKVHDMHLFARFAGVFIAQILLVGTYETLTAKLKQEIRKLSITDYQTGLFNHRYFSNTITRKCPRAAKRQENLCFLLLDIDKFKVYNDTYGHLQGDKLLAAVAKVLKKNVKRAGDYAFRLGGEEFAVLLCGTTHAKGLVMAEKIRKEISELKVKCVEKNEDTSVTVSIGFISIIPKEDDSFEPLIKLADDYLYKAKDTGRNRVVDS